MFDSSIPFMKKYNESMRKSMHDKTFFISHIQADVIVDYGCADGATIEYLQTMFPEIQYIGYDISEDQLNLARSNCPNASFYSNWNILKHVIEQNYANKKIAVICNSLIHEVYSYGDHKSIDQFWKNIFDDIFSYVVIRDMSISEKSIHTANNEDVAKIERFRSLLLTDFEQHWGWYF